MHVCVMCGMIIEIGDRLSQAHHITTKPYTMWNAESVAFHHCQTAEWLVPQPVAHNEIELPSVISSGFKISKSSITEIGTSVCMPPNLPKTTPMLPPSSESS